jgi:hypothetical protein
MSDQQPQAQPRDDKPERATRDQQQPRTNLPEGISIADQAEVAGRRRGDTRQDTDDIDMLGVRVREFCDRQGAHTNALSTARTKFAEALYWLRHHRDNPGG